MTLSRSVAVSGYIPYTMKTYSQFRPTGFDNHINIDSEEESRENWLVLPVSRTRDSGPFEESNFSAAVKSLGGEGENVEIHRFGHWGPGWFEIILIRPDTAEATKAEEIESALENYPFLDEEDHSQRCQDEYAERWNSYGAADFIRALVGEFSLAYDTRDFLHDIDNDSLLEFFESCIPSGEYYVEESGGVSICTHEAAKRCTRSQLAGFIREQRNS